VIIVIEVEEIEADAAVDGRRDLDLPAAMREGPQCRLEARPANSVEDDLRAPTFGQTVDRRIARLILEKDEVIDGASRGRPGGKLIPVDPDYASSAPFSDLCGGTADARARARYQQRLAPGECGIFDDTQPGGEIGDTDGKADLSKNSPSMLLSATSESLAR
jgi:hypothetical protein